MLRLHQLRLMHRIILAAAGLLAVASPALAQSPTETVLYSFPNAATTITDSFIQASDGNFYGTGSNGIYKFLAPRPGFPTPAQSFATLHAANPKANDPGDYYGMIEASDGNFYGYALLYQVINHQTENVGQVFKITPDGAFSTLYAFCSAANCADGEIPIGQLTQGSDGYLYGATLAGGGKGSGTLFRLSLSGKFTTLHTFCSQSSCADGSTETSGLLQASDGNFYGSTGAGGAYGGGTLFQYTPSGEFTTLTSICGNAAFYGCTASGIDWPFSRMVENSPGTIFQFAESGSVYSFDTEDGSLNITGSVCASGYDCSDQPLPAPDGFLFPASDGNLYAAGDGGNYEAGVIFNQYADAVYSFCAKPGCPDGALPSFLVQGSDGALYGIFSAGGARGFGGIFRLQPGAGQSAEFPAPVAVTASNYNVLAGQSVALDWTVANAISTTMQQCSSWLNGSPHGKVPPTGAFTFTPPSTGTWTAAITCGGIETGYATITVTNKAVATTTKLAASSTVVAAGGSVTLSAQVAKTGGVTAVPRGTVTFKAGSLVLGTATLDPTGAASLTASTKSVAPGSYSITATYDGDPGDIASTSPALSIIVK